MRSLLLVLSLSACAIAGAQTADYPIWVDLARPQTVTVAIDDASGRRVRNLISETRLPAGRQRLSWDGYDDGVYATDGTLTRHRVPPGTYTARGLVHDGLKTIYECTPYSGGNPPWQTKDGLGGWLADHSSPLGATFIPSGSPYGGGKPQVLLTALVAEAGRTTVWVGTDGTTYQRRAMWGWDGGEAAATDFGADRDPRYYAYVLMCWGEQSDVVLRGLTKDGGPDIAKFKPTTKMPKEPRELGLALSVRDGLAAVSLPLDNAVLFIDVKRGRALGTAPVPSPKGVLLDGQGRLLVSTEGTVKRYAVHREGDAAPTLADATELIRGLDDPRTLQTNLAGNELFVADWGRSHQVKVFGLDGQPKRVIGKPGGFQRGVYDEQRMHRPCGLAIDDQGQLWIAEADWLPKRISLWDAATGRFKSARYGPPHYGGGGTIDAVDKTRFFYAEFGGLLEFRLDWQTGTARLVAIPIRNIDLPPTHDPMPNHTYGETVPELPMHVGGRLYLLGGYQGGLRGNDTHAVYLYDDATHTARPVCHVGSMRHWESIRTAPFIGDLQKAGGIYEPFLCWTDLNADGKVTQDEFQVRRFAETLTKADGSKAPLFGFRDWRPGPGLEQYGSWSLRLPAPAIRADGTPLYDLSKATFLVPPDDDQHWAEDGHGGVMLADGTWVQGFRAYRGGRWVWSYPSLDSTFMPPQYPGHVVEPTRLLGPPFTPGRGEARDVLCYNGERGNMYLLTGDGLYLGTLGAHMSRGELFPFAQAKRGLDVSGYSFEDEHFHPTITRTADGNVYMVAGKEHSSIFRIDGFDTVKRRAFGTVALSADAQAKLPERWVQPGRKQGRGELNVPLRATAPTVDGGLADWSKATWATIGSSGSGALAVAGDRLYAAWRTGRADALANDASDPPFAFKRGGAVDLLVGPADRRGVRNDPIAGDVRLLLTLAHGKPLAVLYRQVAPGLAGARPQLYESPIGRVSFDDVRVVTDQVQLAQRGGDIEVSVPLALLGLSGRAGEQCLGDIGILRGNGVQTLARDYWNNLDTALVSDIPSEARLAPSHWGVWKVVAGE